MLWCKYWIISIMAETHRTLIFYEQQLTVKVNLLIEDETSTTGQVTYIIIQSKQTQLK